MSQPYINNPIPNGQPVVNQITNSNTLNNNLPSEISPEAVIGFIGLLLSAASLFLPFFTTTTTHSSSLSSLYDYDYDFSYTTSDTIIAYNNFFCDLIVVLALFSFILLLLRKNYSFFPVTVGFTILLFLYESMSDPSLLTFANEDTDFPESDCAIYVLFIGVLILLGATWYSKFKAAESNKLPVANANIEQINIQQPPTMPINSEMQAMQVNPGMPTMPINPESKPTNTHVQ